MAKLHLPDEAPPPATPTWRRYLSFWGTRVAHDLDHELRFHLEMRIQDFKRRGMTDPEARAEAIRRLGDLDPVRERCVHIASRREKRMARARTWDAFVQDVRYGLRQLARSPGWTLVASLTLALGIGATTAVFSVINSLIVNPLPYRDADRVVNLMMSDAKSGVSMSPRTSVSAAWKKRATTLEGLEVFSTSPATLTGRGPADRIGVAAVSETFMAFTGVPMLRGRSFTPDDLRHGAQEVAMLTEGLWRKRFGSDESVLGSTISIDDAPHRIIGVTPSRLRLTAATSRQLDVLVPFDTMKVRISGIAVARLKKGVDPERAKAELDLIATQVGPRRPGPATYVVSLVRVSDMVWFKRQIYVVAGAVGLLLLIACANVAHLLLARGATRRRELAIRAAIGAGAGRLVRQLLTESAMLAVLGCAAGVGLAAAGVRALIAFRPERMQQLDNTHLDWRVLVAAVALSVVTGIVFGLGGAWDALRHRGTENLSSGARGGSGSVASERLRSALVVSEMALSTVLLVGALLLAHSIMKLQQVDPGFDVNGLYSAELEIPSSRYDSVRKDQFVDEVTRRLESAPEVAAVTVSSGVPPSHGYMIGVPTVEGRGPLKDERLFTAANWVDPNYFAVLGLRVLEGRPFGAVGAESREGLINVGAARRLWPGRSAIGQRFKIVSPGFAPDSVPWATIVGVVSDAVAGSVTDDHGDLLVYYPRSSTRGLGNFAVAVRGRPGMNPTAAIQRIVGQIDPRLAPPKVLSVQQALRDTFAETRFSMLLMMVFAIIAVILSAIGLYGVIAYAVTQRTREIGIRIALGASRGHVAGRVVGQGLTLAGLGLIFGLVGGVLGAKAIAAMLFGVDATDPLALGLSGGALAVVALIATLVPMRRATLVDPAITMRAE